MKVISSNLPKGRFETCPYPVLLSLHGVVKANWYKFTRNRTLLYTSIITTHREAARQTGKPAARFFFSPLGRRSVDEKNGDPMSVLLENRDGAISNSPDNRRQF